MQATRNKMISENWTDEKNSSAAPPAMRPHRRQFVIGVEAFRAHEDWCCHQLDASTWVSYCPELLTGWAKDADGVSWVLLGLAIETIADKATPIEQIAQTRSTNISDLYFSWAGRWVLIGWGEVHMDASGLLGCFYGKSDNRTWISSSAALLAPILSPVPAAEDRVLRYQIGISWFTPPRSRFVGIHRLLPSQVLEINTGNIRPRPLMPPIDRFVGYDKTLELLQHSLVTTLQQLVKAAGKPWLGMTAGYDSRLMLAIARSAGIEVMPYTRISARMTVADRLLPPQLARECGYKHVFLRGSKGNLDRKHLVAEHSSGHVSDGDAEPFIQGMRDRLQGISFGGHGFAIASGFGSLRLLPSSVTDPEIGAAQIAGLFGSTSSSAIAGIRDWLQWAIAHLQEHLDWRDRFFIEQRQAGWLSSKEQLYDLVRLERFPILNAARNYALLLGLEESQRLGSLVQLEMIRRLAPELLKYPFNPPTSYFGILQAIACKTINDPLYVWRQVLRKLPSSWRVRSALSRG